MQGEFFRSSMGLPSGTSHDAIIVDLAVPKQSLRFSFCRKKLKARMDFEITPPIVNKQRDHYKSSFSDKFEIKQFTGVTKQECVMKRSEWIRHHPDRIIPPRKETLEKFIPTLSIPTGSKYGFRHVYPYESGTHKWKANLKVKAGMDFPKVSDLLYEHLSSKLGQAEGIRNSAKVFRNTFRNYARKAIVDAHLSDFKQRKGCRVLKSLRTSWYHDKLIHEIVDPRMRLVRKLRVGASELRDHSFYLNGFSRSCPQCEHVREDLQHFFFECPSYKVQREVFLAETKKLLDKINCVVSTATVLGFHPNLKNRRFTKSTVDLRRKVFQQTMDFISSTGRFQYT